MEVKKILKFLLIGVIGGFFVMEFFVEDGPDLKKLGMYILLVVVSTYWLSRKSEHTEE